MWSPFATPSMLVRSWQYVSRRGLFVHLGSILQRFLTLASLHSEHIKDVWSVSKWAWWFEHQYQLSKCTVVSEQWRTFLRNLLVLPKKTIITCSAVVNQVYPLHLAVSRLLHSLGPSTLHSRRKMRALPKHRRAASLATFRNQHRPAAFLVTTLPSRHRPPVSLETAPPNPHRQAASLATHRSQRRPVAFLAILLRSLNKEQVCLV